MANKNYVAGAVAEREFIKLAVSTGRWIGVRSAGSHGPFDGVLICTNPTIDLAKPTPRGPLLIETGVVLFQMKRYSKSKTNPTDDFKNLHMPPDGVSKWWVTRQKGKKEFEIEVI